MPRIFDNVEQQLLPALCESIEVADRPNFCVGRLNLWWWKRFHSFIDCGGRREHRWIHRCHH